MRGETVGREIFWEIPNDYPTMVESRNNGVPLVSQAPKAKLTRAIEGLARKIDESIGPEALEEELPKKGVKNLFGFLKAGQK